MQHDFPNIEEQEDLFGWWKFRKEKNDGNPSSWKSKQMGKESDLIWNTVAKGKNQEYLNFCEYVYFVIQMLFVFTKTLTLSTGEKTEERKFTITLVSNKMDVKIECYHRFDFFKNGFYHCT